MKKMARCRLPRCLRCPQTCSIGCSAPASLACSRHRESSGPRAPHSGAALPERSPQGGAVLTTANYRPSLLSLRPVRNASSKPTIRVAVVNQYIAARSSPTPWQSTCRPGRCPLPCGACGAHIDSSNGGRRPSSGGEAGAVHFAPSAARSRHFPAPARRHARAVRRQSGWGQSVGIR